MWLNFQSSGNEAEKARIADGETYPVTLDRWWQVAVAGVDFGNEGASSVRMRVKSETASRIEILLDNTEGMPAAILDIPESETYTEITETLTEDFTGVHDLYFRFTESGIFLLEWQFQ